MTRYWVEYSFVESDTELVVMQVEGEKKEGQFRVSKAKKLFDNYRSELPYVELDKFPGRKFLYSTLHTQRDLIYDLFEEIYK